MKIELSMILAASASMLAASGAQAAQYAASGYAESRMTYANASDIPTARTSGYSGVGSVYIQTASTASTGLVGVCTGSLINSTTVLTAAHCLYDHDEAGNYDPVTSISFFLPSLGAAIDGSAAGFGAVNYAFNPDYNGDILSGYDVALFTLGKEATGYDTYDLYYGDPLQQYIEVGTGTIGGPTGTDPSLSDFYKRVGTNIYEYYGDQVFYDVSHGVVLSDFDDGTAAHDVFGQLGGNRQTGIPGESNSSQGDSGGPEFIDGAIATVTSFGISAVAFQGGCGAGYIDPYASSTGRCTNSSVGELAGNTLVSYNKNFIDGYLGVPEPATWAMMIFGFAFVGGAMRRQGRQKAAVSFA
ncbi:MAG: PEPxxWA-CTERM sorting domain-containing protein [Sphingomonadaceae bacterium]